MEKQIFNENFWSEYARMYNKFTPSFQTKLLDYISKFGFGTVGDFGCGVGKLHPYLSRQNKSQLIHAIDSNKEMLELAKTNKSQNIKTIYSQIELNDLNQNQILTSYDSIYLINVLYTNKNPIEVLKQVTPKLNQNGNLIIVDMKRKTNLEQLFQTLNQEYKNDPDLENYYTSNQILSQNSTPHAYSINELESIISLLGNFQTIEKNENHFLENANCLIVKKN